MSSPDDETLPPRPPSTVERPEFASTVDLTEEESKGSQGSAETAETIALDDSVVVAETVEFGGVDEPGQADTRPARAQVGQRGKIGPYLLIEELARGGMGVVYRAKHSTLEHEVALKVLLAGEDASEAELARFLREARAAARLEHPGVVRIHDMGEHRGMSYLAMDLIRGQSLSAKLKHDGPLEAREAATIARDVADALQFAHTHSILHRDLKPGNVLLSEDGRALLTDFGLAKDLSTDDHHTQTGQILGTPVYMPPEQAMSRHDEVDARSDVYSLGATLYEMLVGSPPFSGPSLMSVLRAVIKSPPRLPSTVRPGLDPDLETICLKCLDKEPEGRYPTAQALRDDLTRYLEHRPIAARRPTPLQRGRKWMRRNQQLAGAMLAMSAVALTLLLGSGALFVWRVSEARDEAIERGKETEAARALATKRLGEVEEASRETAAALNRSREQADMARRVLDVLLFDVRSAARRSKDERLLKLLAQLEPGEFGADEVTAAGLKRQQLKFARTLVRISEVQADPASDIRALTHAVELFPPGAEHAEALALLALAYHEHKNSTAAVKTLERAEAVSTTTSPALARARAAIRPARAKVQEEQEQKHDAASLMQAAASGDGKKTTRLLAEMLKKPSLLRRYRQSLQAELKRLKSTQEMVEQQGGELPGPDQKRLAGLELLLKDEGKMLAVLTEAMAKRLAEAQKKRPPTKAPVAKTPKAKLVTATVPGWLGQALKRLHQQKQLAPLLGVRHYRSLERGRAHRASYPDLWKVDLRLEPTRPAETLVLDLEVRALAGFESRTRIVHRFTLGFEHVETACYWDKGEMTGRVQGTQLIYSMPKKGKIDSKPWTAQHTFKTVALFLLPRVVGALQPQGRLSGSFVLDPEFDDYALGWLLERDPQGWRFTSDGKLRWHLQTEGGGRLTRIEQHGSGPGITPKVWVPLSAATAKEALASADVLSKDPAKLEAKAKAGHRDALYEWGKRLRNAMPTADDPRGERQQEQSIAYLRRAAAQGHAQACFELGERLSAVTLEEMRGKVPLDRKRIEEGLALLEQGARLGVAECLRVLGQRHDPTREPVDPTRRALYDRASSYALNRGPRRQPWRTEAAARKHYGRAEAAGLSSARLELATMLTKLAALERVRARPKTEASAKAILERLAEALRLVPTHLNALQLRATLWTTFGQPQRAVADLTTALEANLAQQRKARYRFRGLGGTGMDSVTAQLLARRARAHEAAGNFPLALADLNRCVEARARNARLTRARYHLRQGQLKLALVDLDALLKRRSRNPTALHLRGQARLAAGDVKGAAEDMSRAFKAWPRASWGLDAGFLNAGVGRWAEAKQAFVTTAKRYSFAAIGARALGVETPALAKLARGKDAWARTLAALVSDELPLAKALEIADASPKPAEKRCEALGYAALMAERAGDLDVARPLYAGCVQTGVTAFHEYSLAQRRLKALGN